MEFLHSYYFYMFLSSGALSVYSFNKFYQNNIFSILAIISTVIFLISPISLYKDLTNGYSNVNYNTNIYTPMNISFFINTK